MSGVFLPKKGVGETETLKKLCRRIFFLPGPVAGILALLSAGLLVPVFACGWEDTPLAYAAYLLSAYALTVVLAGLPGWCKKAAGAVKALPAVSKIKNRPLVRRFLADPDFREKAAVCQGLAVSAAYVLFRGIGAFLYGSVWFGAIAVYYLFLGMIRLFLAGCLRSAGKAEGAKRQLLEYQGYWLCGWLILLLHSGMSGMLVLMVWDNRHYDYPGAVIYLSALYTFYLFITASVNWVKHRKRGSPILSASKAVSLLSAAMSVMALQSAMLARFGAEDALFRQRMNTVTGTVICLFSLSAALFMMIRGSVRLSAIKEGPEAPPQ